ncbi:MAG TPA: bifunctional DNA-formamidopyrimidine glycosylase/DNA-(apurinic or apyrimidinic site) lyase [Anaerolinea thermolimosa]|uniref:Bifunctional DNA-formamidopyrimidine glycosylase/DNA-(Apurinic or apyrimidinic site) lyase n=1 Tax=Anaerolinea thermolimosa TaxID=229919 RepID=A0A3D1JG23_9CHLR|nr:bifunctional DNA-formamidopyrimidine glycosylase/DNA-(apurinic or apyrimidinic site) lyase [Anaerolinea thermolimosa]GAP07211.1 DNA-(apurinic or apyrimidinic site) lyase [Anaerolinea thermolimosa]HCE16556.1 bifunctional DNA-formamidopyrimidine glycosylase/DNA-(apurinic or apyrimidinic site) lyase [Anaerolinea thermolimosa]
MPELPEVETIVRALREGGRGGEAVPGHRIEGVDVSWPRSVAEPSVEVLTRQVVGQRIETVTRRGKFVVLPLDTQALLIHLRMSGDLRVETTGERKLPHDRIRFFLSGGLSLVFNDPRKFGRVWLVEDWQKFLAGLGPEPLDEKFTADELAQRLGMTRRRIKPLLLDQTFLAGLGNIYTDEALHLAGIHPLAPAWKLSAEQVVHLWRAIRSVLMEGIRRNGASIDWVYRGGEFQHHFRVYQRAGMPCSVCGSAIQRMVVGQRGTYFCPVCQPPWEE